MDTYWSKASRYQPPLSAGRTNASPDNNGKPITEFSTAWQGLMDGLMDQISNHSSFERAAVDSPDRRPTRRMWRVTAAGVVLAVLAAFTYLGFFHHREARAVAPPAAPPLVTVSRPLQRAVDTRLGFLGQFSAVDRIEVRAQVGGTLTEIHFKDGQIVHKGDLLFVIDPRPYEIKLAQ